MHLSGLYNNGMVTHLNKSLYNHDNNGMITHLNRSLYNNGMITHLNKFI